MRNILTQGINHYIPYKRSLSHCSPDVVAVNVKLNRKNGERVTIKSRTCYPATGLRRPSLLVELMTHKGALTLLRRQPFIGASRILANS